MDLGHEPLVLKPETPQPVPGPSQTHAQERAEEAAPSVVFWQRAFKGLWWLQGLGGFPVLFCLSVLLGCESFYFLKFRA